MILEFILYLVVGFVIVVTGSYVGAKMALNTVFGRDFDPSEPGKLAPADSASDSIEE